MARDARARSRPPWPQPAGVRHAAERRPRWPKPRTPSPRSFSPIRAASCEELSKAMGDRRVSTGLTSDRRARRGPIARRNAPFSPGRSHEPIASRRPWLSLYRDVPPTMSADQRDAPRHVPGRRSSATATHRSCTTSTARCRQPSSTRCRTRSPSRLQERGVDAGRSHRGVPAEHPAGRDRGARRLEVRRGRRAVQSDAARARAGARSCRTPAAAC